MRKALLAFTVLLFFVAAAAIEANACYCTAPGENSVKPTFLTAETVFQGKIVSEVKEKWKISVSQVWKGKVEDEVYVVDTMARTSCGGGWKKDKEYMFFVSTTNDFATIKEYNKIKSPIRRDELQVFFDKSWGCGIGTFLSAWNKTLESHDKENFWQTLKADSPIKRKEK